MLQAGARVTLVANSAPALNDIIFDELDPLLRRGAAGDSCLQAALADGRLTTVASGSSAPLLDLTRLDDACVEALRGADLVILHGMGRSIESNYQAAFACDVLHAAVLKDDAVVARMQGRLFDCVFRYRSA
jgi:type II pantothenate kinase